MSTDQRLQSALDGIRRILDADGTYPTPALKLGAIWDVCDRHAEYRRGTALDYTNFIEVMPR